MIQNKYFSVSIYIFKISRAIRNNYFDYMT